MTKFNWTDKSIPSRKAVAYAAVSAQEATNETYAEFQAVTSGWKDQSSYELFIDRKYEQAINLFSIAGRHGFIDC